MSSCIFLFVTWWPKEKSVFSIPQHISLLNCFLYNYLICHILWFKIIFYFTDIYINYYISFCFLFVYNLSIESIVFRQCIYSWIFFHKKMFLLSQWNYPNFIDCMLSSNSVQSYQWIRMDFLPLLFSSFEYFSSSVSKCLTFYILSKNTIYNLCYVVCSFG